MTVKFEFQGTAHRNSREMHDAIANEWLSAGGFNMAEEIAQLLSRSDEYLADEVVEAFGLDDHSFLSRKSLRDAFARIRDDVDKHFPNDQ